MNQKIKQSVYVCLTLLSIISVKQSKAQCTEKVINGNFETLSSTPPWSSSYAYGQYFYLATGWNNWTGTGGSVDLFNTASATTVSGTGMPVSVPCNFAGYQSPQSGNTYAGLLTVEPSGNPTHSPYNNEFMESYFASNLTAGKIYEVSLWVSRADLSRNTITSLGIWLKGDPSTGLPDLNCPIASLNNDAWTKITFPYCANGTEYHIVIGGSSTTYGSALTVSGNICSPGNNVPNYYGDNYVYIDDVSVKEVNFIKGLPFLVCPKTPVNFSLSPLCGIDPSLYSYTWNFGDGTAPYTSGPSASHTYNTSGSFSGGATVSTGGCSAVYGFAAGVPNTSASISSGAITTICNGTYCFTATPNPSGSYFTNWYLTDAATNAVIPTSSYTITNGTTLSPCINFANINQNVYVHVSMSRLRGCPINDSLFMPSCCTTPTNAVTYANPTYNSSFAFSASATPIVLSGVVTVNNSANLSFLNCELIIQPNTKFVLNNSAGLTITNSYVHGCNYMWDGIYPNTNNSVIISNSRIEDAKRVVIDSLGTASINITGSYLNKNYQGVVFKSAKSSTSVVTLKNNFFSCSNVPTSGSLPYISATASLSNAPTLGAYSSANLLPPYSTVKSYCGVLLTSASHIGKTNSAITIGGNTNEENVFDKMQYGAVGGVSNVIYQNNVFQNMKSSIAPISGGANMAIVVSGLFFGSGGPYYTQIGGSSVSVKNTFKDNDNGVTNIFRTGLVIENNRFENQTATAVGIGFNSNNSTVNVAHNKFLNNKIGINFEQNTLINATISENWLDNTSPQGTYADNFAIRTTEVVLATNPSSYPAYSVYNNYITGYYNGIYAALTFKASIRDNEIHMLSDATSGNYQSAIQINGTNDNEVYNNTSDYPSGTSINTWQYNIFTNSSTVPKIHCNNTNYGGVGIMANGLNYTAAGNGFYGNVMNNQFTGFWLNANGEIGNQYYTAAGTNYSADNSWTGNFYQTYVSSGSNSSSAIFYTRSVAPYKLTSAGYAGAAPSQLSGTNNSTGFTGACYGGISTPTLNLRVAGAEKPVMQQATEIAKGTLAFDDNEASLKHIARKQLLSNLKLAKIGTSYNTEVADFMTSSKLSSLGVLFLVDSLINTGGTANLILAGSMNDGIATANDVDAMQQAFNTEYMAYLKNQHKANASGILTFEKMAYQCPMVYGQAVYQARSVLFGLTQKQYMNACEKSDVTTQRLASAVVDEVAADVKLFPNPSNGNITLQTGDDLGYSVTVYNLLGEKVFESMTSNNQSIYLADVSSGIYIVHIYQSDNLIKTERISIVH